MPNLTVPYDPVPQQGPADIPTPFRTDTGATPLAFGAGIGEAMQKFGATMEQTADTLSKQVLAQQDLINQAAVDKGDAAVMTRAGAEHVRFSSLPDDQKKGAYQTYANNLWAIRAEERTKMPNQMAAKMFDRQTMGTIGRTIFNGAGAVGTAIRKDAETSSIGAAQAASDLALANVGTEHADEDLKKATVAWRAAGVQSGLHGDALEEYVKEKGTSPIHLGNVEHLSNSGQTEEAQAYREAHKDQMTGGDLEKADGRILQQQQATASTYVAQSVLDANRDKETGKINITEAEAIRQLDQTWDKLHPDDKRGKVIAENQIRTQLYQDNRVRHNDMVKSVNDIKGLIINKNMSSLQQIMLDPVGSKAVDYLRHNNPEIDVNALITNRVLARDKEPNERALGKMKVLRYENQQQFRALDPYDPKMGLNQKQADEVAAWQAHDNAVDRANDPRPQKALTQLIPYYGQALGDAGVIKYNGRARDDDTYFNFMSDLINSMDAWQDTHEGRPPTDKDMVDVIGKKILNQEKYNMFFGYGPQAKGEPYFKTIPEPDEKWLARRKVQVPEATEEDLKQQWRRDQYRKLYGTTPSSRKLPEQDRGPATFGERFPETLPTETPKGTVIVPPTSR